MAGVIPGISNYEIAHITLYKVHQRVAKTFKLGRAFLIGDAAHINNPLGGMGMNGGIHDAVNLATRLAAVWRGEADDAELERFDKQRRLVTLEYIQKYTIQNKKNLESPGDEFRQSLQAIAADPARTRDYLMRVSMIASLLARRGIGLTIGRCDSRRRLSSATDEPLRYFSCAIDRSTLPATKTSRASSSPAACTGRSTPIRRSSTWRWRASSAPPGSTSATKARSKSPATISPRRSAAIRW